MVVSVYERCNTYLVSSALQSLTTNNLIISICGKWLHRTSNTAPQDTTSIFSWSYSSPRKFHVFDPEYRQPCTDVRKWRWWVAVVRGRLYLYFKAVYIGEWLYCERNNLYLYNLYFSKNLQDDQLLRKGQSCIRVRLIFMENNTCQLNLIISSQCFQYYQLYTFYQFYTTYNTLYK